MVARSKKSMEYTRRTDGAHERQREYGIQMKEKWRSDKYGTIYDRRRWMRERAFLQRGEVQGFDE